MLTIRPIQLQKPPPFRRRLSQYIKDGDNRYHTDKPCNTVKMKMSHQLASASSVTGASV